MALARAFRAHNKDLYLVGGSVRDLLLHRETSSDVDMTTDARPDEIKRIVAVTNPIAVVTVGEQFGTVRLHYRRTPGEASIAGDASAPEGASADTPGQAPTPTPIVAEQPADVDVIEITTYRSDRYNPESRKPEVTFGDTLEGDLLRRDFTINAMARDPLTGEIIDPYGGREDLARRLIRAVGDDPARRFDEDPLRMLRAARFAAQLGFQIEPATLQAMERQAATLGKISRERIRDEFTKALVTPAPDVALRLLVNQGLMSYIVAEVLELKGVSQQPQGRSKDVFEHVVRVVAGIPARPAARWAALLHDIAKPRTRTVEEGHVHFFGHEDVGAVMARDILRRLKFDRPFIDYVARLVKLHMRANAYTSEWTDGAVRRLMLDAGATLPDLLDLSRADITSYRIEKVTQAAARVNELEARAKWLREEAERVPLKSPLDGDDLMALFGRGPGPWLRPIKDHLLELVIDGALAPDDKAAAEDEARRFVANDPAFQPGGPLSSQAPTTKRAAASPQAAAMPGGAAQPQPAHAHEATHGDDRANAAHSSDATAPTRATRRARGDMAPKPQQETTSTSGPETTDEARRESKYEARAATRHPAPNASLTLPVEQGETAPFATPPDSQPSPLPAGEGPGAGAARDAIIAFLDGYLNIARFRDVAPNGLQVVGKRDVRRVALGVSAHLALIEAAIAGGADMIIVHHGLFIDRDSHVIHERQKRRLKALFDHDITLLGYHLPLDAHPEIGNNVQWLRRLGYAIETLEFGQYHNQWIGAIGVAEGEPPTREALVAHIGELAGAAPRVYPFGPERVRRLAVATGAVPGSLEEAVARGCDAYLTGETAEYTQAIAQEERATFIAAGHYNTERFGVQALGDVLRERFGVEPFFVEVPNDV